MLQREHIGQKHKTTPLSGQAEALPQAPAHFFLRQKKAGSKSFRPSKTNKI